MPALAQLVIADLNAVVARTIARLFTEAEIAKLAAQIYSGTTEPIQGINVSDALKLGNYNG